MGQKRLIIGFQDQKPLGTRNEDFEFSLYSCYKPLLTFLYANPEMKISLYLSGIIYEWLESNYPEINMLIADMVKRKQLELLSGGFYDPIFQIIPAKDRTQQIEMTTTYIRKRFGYRARSAWITEQVWNPQLIASLSTCGITSLIQHLEPQTNDLKPFSMQEMGNMIKVYPIHRALTFALNNKDYDYVKHALSATFKKPHANMATIMLDVNTIISNSIIGDPHTIVELSKRLQEICNELDITTVLPMNMQNEIIRKQGYQAMGWFKDTLPKDIKHFNQMFLKYPEMKNMYGKLLYVSRLIPGIKKEKSLKKIASKELLKAESFGGFSISQNGGVYQNYLRKENYQHMIEVEKLSREKGVFSTSITSYDLDLDGEEEYIYRGKNITSVFDKVGATMIELDYLVNSWNYLDTFVGHSEEIVHSTIPSIPKGTCQRGFTDLFISDQALSPTYDKYSDKGIYSLEDTVFELDRLDKDQKNITFSTNVKVPFLKNTDIHLIKKFTCHTNTIQLDYKIFNNSKRKIEAKFGSEMNLSFAYDSEDMLEIASFDLNLVREMSSVDSRLNNVKLLRFKDLNKKAIVSLFSDKRYSVIKENYNTTIHTQLGEEDIYQYTRTLPFWDLDIKPGEFWENTISIRIEKMK